MAKIEYQATALPGSGNNLFNTAFNAYANAGKNFTDALGGLAEQGQDWRDTQLNQYIASQYDANNLNSINEAIKNAATNPAFANASAKAWNNINKERANWNTGLNTDNLAQDEVRVASANNAMQAAVNTAMTPNNVRYANDLIKGAVATNANSRALNIPEAYKVNELLLNGKAKRAALYASAKRMADEDKVYDCREFMAGKLNQDGSNLQEVLNEGARLYGNKAMIKAANMLGLDTIYNRNNKFNTDPNKEDIDTDLISGGKSPEEIRAEIDNLNKAIEANRAKQKAEANKGISTTPPTTGSNSSSTGLNTQSTNPGSDSLTEDGTDQSTLYSTQIGSTDPLRQREALDLDNLIRGKDNNPTITANSNAGNNLDMQAQLAKQVQKTQGLWVKGISNKFENPQEAKDFIDLMNSPEGQAALKDPTTKADALLGLHYAKGILANAKNGTEKTGSTDLLSSVSNKATKNLLDKVVQKPAEYRQSGIGQALQYPSTLLPKKFTWEDYPMLVAQAAGPVAWGIAGFHNLFSQKDDYNAKYLEDNKGVIAMNEAIARDYKENPKVQEFLDDLASSKKYTDEQKQIIMKDYLERHYDEKAKELNQDSMARDNYNNLVKQGKYSKLTEMTDANNSIYLNNEATVNAGSILEDMDLLQKARESFAAYPNVENYNAIHTLVNNIGASYTSLKASLENSFTGSKADFISTESDKMNLSSRFSDYQIISMNQKGLSNTDISAFTEGLNIPEGDEKKIKSLLGSGSITNLLDIVMANNHLDESDAKDALHVAQQFSGLNPLAVAAAAEKFCYVDNGVFNDSYEFNAKGFKDYLQTLQKVTPALNNNALSSTLNNHDYQVLQQYNAITDAKVKQANAIANWEKVYNYALETANITNGYASQIVKHSGRANRGSQAIYFSGASKQHEKMQNSAQKALNAMK